MTVCRITSYNVCYTKLLRLSTIVVLAYGHGYQLGEVVGTQLLTGCILAWMLALYTKLKERRKLREEQGKSGNSVNATADASSKLTWKQRLLLMLVGTPTAITGLVYYHSLQYIPASLAIILLFQFTWIRITSYNVCYTKLLR